LEVEGSKSLDVAQLTFNDLADFYVTHYCKPAEYTHGKKVAGLRDVKRAQGFLVRFREYFGKRRLSQIAYSDVYAYRAARLRTHTHYKRTPTVASMNRELGVLRRILNIGFREGWLARNPFCAGEPLISPSAEGRRESILTAEEESRLLLACDQLQRKYLRAFVICLLDTGARRSEMLKLRWRSVCFSTGAVTIEGMTTKTLKTRQVKMTERMTRELSGVWDDASNRMPDGLVFETTAISVTRAFKRACKSAAIQYGSPDGITLHSLRHTPATRLVKGQMPLQMVGRLLGHSQPHTTYRYLSVDAEATAQAAAILEAFQVETFQPAPTELLN
jgi:integrase